MSGREQLRLAAQLDPGIWIEAGLGITLWRTPREVARRMGTRRSMVFVPSCNASGKTHTAARVALALYDAHTPGTPCQLCGGPCGGIIVVTTSASWDQLRDALWSEIRMAWMEAENRGLRLPGSMPPADLRVTGGPNHKIIARSPDSHESMQGYHAAHVVVIVDESTSVSTKLASGLQALRSTGDVRLLAIANPTDDVTWLAGQCRSFPQDVVRIDAFSTPLFRGMTDEEIESRWPGARVRPDREDPGPPPPGSDLITPEWLDDLQDAGMGPGSYEWVTRVEADFWSMGEDTLLTGDWVDAAWKRSLPIAGQRSLGIDLAAFGTGEQVIGRRSGDVIHLPLSVYPPMQQSRFWETAVVEHIMSHKPHTIIYDADGVGAGVRGEAERAITAAKLNPPPALIPVRGSTGVGPGYRNLRSLWWWRLRGRFQSGKIALMGPADDKLREQLLALRYSFTEKGAIKVESKQSLMRRGVPSIDRADAIVYASSYDAMDVPHPTSPDNHPDSDAQVWKRKMRELDAGPQPAVHDTLGVADW